MTEKKEIKSSADEDIDALGIWSPGDPIEADETNFIKPEKEDPSSFDFDKDKKRIRLSAEEMLSGTVSSLEGVSVITHNIDNALNMKSTTDIINACKLVEASGYQSFVNFGNIILAAKEDCKWNNELTVKMGKIWDKTDYSSLKESQIQEFKDELAKELSDAYVEIERIEDEWADKRDEESKLKNESAMFEWLSVYPVKLTEITKKITHLMNQKRSLEEDKEERSRYKSVGEALKNRDIPEFTRLLRKREYDRKVEEDLEELNKLLIYAVHYGIEDAIFPIVEEGASINKIDNEGKTLFMQALEIKSLDVAKELKRSGAVVGVKDLEGTTELVVAINSGSIESVKYLVEELGMDAKNDEHGINNACWRGFTPLIYAVSGENIEITKYLLQKGANPMHEVHMEDNATADRFTENKDILRIIEEAQAKWLDNKYETKPLKM